MRAAALLIALSAGFAPAAAAAIYTCTDSSGQLVFRDKPCKQAERKFDARVDAGVDGGVEARVESGAPTQRPPASRKRGSETEAAPALDRAQVEKLVARLDNAMGKRDAKAVLALLAQDAVVSVPADRTAPRTELDRKGYGQYLARVFGAGAYTYRPAPGRTSLSKRTPQASVSRQIRETAWVNGRLAVVEVKERLTLEPQGRGLRIQMLRKELPAAGG